MHRLFGQSRRPFVLGVLLAGLAAPVGAQSTGILTGRVTTETGARPLAAAQVILVGTTLGAQTNDAGEYRLASVPVGSHQVRVQRVGYAPATRPVTVAAGETVTLDVQLREAAIALEQIVVTATGEQRKKEIAHSLSTISAAEVQNAPVQNTQQLITARVPGVTVLSNSGQPGSGGTIRLRGNNSISQGNNPIIYVDGVRIYSGATPIVPNARQVTNPFNDINAEDIERIEIVKGAAATTLYGTEASGGVIQIFTKRGSSGAPQWMAEASAGTNDLKQMGPDGDPSGLYVKQCRGPELYGVDIVDSVNRAPNPNFGKLIRFADPTCPASGSWLRTGIVQRYSVSVRGGAQTTNYFASGNIGSEQGALPSSELKNGGFRGNFSFSPIRQLELSLNSAYTKQNVQWVPDGNLANGFLLNVGRGPAGNFRGGGCDTTQVRVCVNNAQILTLTTFTRSDHFITGFTAVHTPWSNLTNRLTVGYDYNNSENRSIIPFGHPRLATGSITQNNWRRKFLSLDYASTLQNEFRSFTSSFSLGGQLFQDNLEQTNVTGTQFGGPGDPTLTTAAVRTVPTDIRRRVINAGFFLQEQLAWRDRLFVTGGLRVDGNSSFGEDFGLQTYPKLGVSYVLSDHAFWPAQWVETLKLRAALGESGKAPGAFDAVRTWDPQPGDEAKPGFTPNQIGNPALGPERTRELELGFEASVLAGRGSVDFTYFKTRTLDALIQVTYPPSEGFLERQLENLGEIQNTGIEASLQLGILRLEKVDWRTRLNYTEINSKARDLAGEPEIAIGDRTSVKVGFPVPSLFGTRVLNPNAFAEPILDTVGFLGPTFPNKIIGLGTTATLWGALTLDALGEFQRGARNINYIGYANANRGAWKACIPIQQKLAAAALGDASALSDVRAIDRARCAIDDTKQNSEFWIEPTDFFKLRYVSLTYILPTRFLRGGLKSATVSVAGRNLFTSTDYSGLDPESADLSDNTFARREYYVFPAMRSFTTTVRVNF